MTAAFRDRLLAGEVLDGTIVTLTTPQVSEALAGVGFDWLWIDMEHAPLDLAMVQSLIVAAGPQCASVVRVPANDPVWLKRVLDLGPAGVIVPHVNSPEEARRAVSACRYPPRGSRSVGIGRAQRYGPGLADTLSNAHERLAIMLQIEHIDAVGKIDEILAVDGVDCAVVGPFDLSASLGRPGALGDPDVISAMKRVASACSSAGVPAGLFAGNSDFASKWRAEGFDVIAVEADVTLLSERAKSVLEALRSG